jgi:hypothetical protein
MNKYFPSSSDDDKYNFSFLFFALIHGLYPLTHLTSNQIEAMKTASPNYTVPRFEEKFYQGLLLLTTNL